jgi:hypothetical protein
MSHVEIQGRWTGCLLQVSFLFQAGRRLHVESNLKQATCQPALSLFLIHVNAS